LYENSKSEINKLKKLNTKLDESKSGLEKDLRRAEEINARLNQQKDAKATTVLKSQNKDKEVDELKQDLERVRVELQEANERNLVLEEVEAA
jgi:hypothetical protein